MTSTDKYRSNPVLAGAQLVLERKAPRIRTISALIRVRQAVAARNEACWRTSATIHQPIVGNTPHPAFTRANAKMARLRTPTTTSARYGKADTVMPVKIANAAIKNNMDRLPAPTASFQIALNNLKTTEPSRRHGRIANAILTLRAAKSTILPQNTTAAYREIPPAAT
jgi:hypothetical protein